MKIRSGFVSNSSSSSFVIIGVTSNWANRLAKAEGKNYSQEPETKTVPGCECNAKREKFCPNCGAPKDKTIEVEPTKEPDYLSYGADDGKVVRFFGTYELEYAGLDAEELLQDMSIKDARRHFVEVVEKKLKIKVPIDAVDFHFGEVGDG
jgi:hypothetical protein